MLSSACCFCTMMVMSCQAHTRLLFKQNIYLELIQHGHIPKEKPYVSRPSQQTDLVGLWPALSFGTSCRLLHEPSTPTHRTVSNEHKRCSCFNVWASRFRWPLRNCSGGGLDYNININIGLLQPLLWYQYLQNMTYSRDFELLML